MTFDPGTRLLTVTFVIPLASPPNPTGATGLPDGATRNIPIGMRLPLETTTTSGQSVSNSATFAGSNTNTVTDTVAVAVDIPRLVRPRATKSWNPASALAQSDTPSTITLGARNASSTSAQVSVLAVTDVTDELYEKMNVTALGPVTRYPAGADQVRVGVCVNTVPCTPAGLVAGDLQTGGGPLALPAGVDPATVTGVRFEFSNSGGAVLPYDPTGGTVEVHVVLRDTLRSNGAPFVPPIRDRIDNSAVPDATDPVAGTVVGDPATSGFDVIPNITKVTTAKTFVSDTNNDFTADGTAVAGQAPGAGVTMTVKGTNASGFPVAVMTITEPDPAVPGAVATFGQVEASRIRFSRPAGATTTAITVTCRDGSSGSFSPPQASGTLDVAPGFCPAGVYPSSVSVTYRGTDVGGNGTIADKAVGGLDLTGRLLTTTPAGVLGNCAVSSVDNPVNSSGAATANGCANLTVQPASSSTGGTKSSNTNVIVPGQPLTFTLTAKNNGNLPSSNVVVIDPVDPTAASNPFTLVRLTSLQALDTGTASTLEVWDPDTGGYVPYVATDAALLSRALGIRATVTGQLQPGGQVRFQYTVLLRDGITPDPNQPVTFRNCAAIGIGTPNVSSPFCNNSTISIVPGSTGGQIQKLFQPAQLLRPLPGLPTQTSTMKLRVSNTGNLNLKRIVVTDVDHDFFDAYLFAGNVRVNRPPGADRSQLDVCTSLTLCDAGTFVNGTPTSSSTPALPGGVTAGQVFGFRVTFSNSGGGYVLTPGSNFPVGGSCPAASICVDVQPRAALVEGGGPLPVSSQDTVSAAGESSQQAAGETFSIGQSPATLGLVDGAASMDIDKDPDSRVAPGETAPFVLVVENTGQGAISGLVVDDPFPAGLRLDPNFPGGAPGQPYTISYQLPDGVAAPTSVVFETEPDPGDPNRIAVARWRFPGWTYYPGAKITILYQVQLDPGAQAGQVLRNTARVTAGVPFTCTPDRPDDGTVTDGGQTYCTSYADITTLAGTSVFGQKWVSGQPSLGFMNSLTGVVTPISDPVCPRLTLEGEVFTRYPCVALNYPGQGFDYLLQLTNASNNAITSALRVLDVLPHLGDTGVLLTDQPRGTEWSSRPLLLEPLHAVGGTNAVGPTQYTEGPTTPPICFSANTPAGCAEPTDWTTADQADLPAVTAFRGDITFPAGGLPPGASAYGVFRVGSPLTLDGSSRGADRVELGRP